MRKQRKRDAKLISQCMKGLSFEERLRKHKLGRACRVDVKNCMQLFCDYQKLKACRVELKKCNYPKIKWYRKRIKGVLPEIRLPKIFLWKISMKTHSVFGTDFNWIKVCKWNYLMNRGVCIYKITFRWEYNNII